MKDSSHPIYSNDSIFDIKNIINILCNLIDTNKQSRALLLIKLYNNNEKIKRSHTQNLSPCPIRDCIPCDKITIKT